MSRLPKIKIKLPSSGAKEYICDLEQAGEYLDFEQGVFVVEGQGVHSYDELVRIVNQDKYKDAEFIVVELLQPIVGG
jgi:hypothetical protein